MDRLFRIDFYPQEWLTQTGNLTPVERGVFIQIVALIYANRGPIENDPAWVGRVSNCSARLARSVIEALASKGSIHIDGLKITQRRCERELNMKRTHIELSSKGGRKSAEKRSVSNKNNGIGPTDSSDSVSSSTATATATATATVNKDTHTQAAEFAEQCQPVRLPEGWNPTINHENRCRSLGHSPDALAAAFRANAKAKGHINRDWDAAFDLWIVNEKKFTPHTKGARNDGQARKPSSGGEEGKRIAEKLRREAVDG
jgi:uncharacterized protein YdaU (DUF1376 family)